MPDRDIFAWNTTMGGFMVSGRLDDRDLVSWNTILKGYAQQGDMDIATTCFRRIPESRDIMEHIDLWVQR
jgi:pentatricopeptide repeat protein